MIGIIYGIAGLMTLVGGILADKLPLKKIYLIGIAAQIPCFFYIAYFSGFSSIFDSSIVRK